MNRFSSRSIINIVFLCLLIVWFIGWESVRYDSNDSNIGKSVVFSTPMVYLENIPNNMAGEYAANIYGSVIRSRTSWENIKPWFPNVIVVEISCTETFVVQDVFYNEAHGFITRAFKQDTKV